jgi:2'-5' RNA ligase
MHSVYLTFEGQSKAEIELLREEYDSLADKIEAHITVVFPTNEIQLEELIKVIDSSVKQEKINLTVSSNINYHGSIGYLNIMDGSDLINRLFCELSGKLGITSKYDYVPHITIIRNSANTPKFIHLSSNDFVVNSAVIEEILPNDQGVVVHQVKI